MSNNEKVKAITENLEKIIEILEVPLNQSTRGTASRIAKMYVEEVFSNMNNNNIVDLDIKMTLFPTGDFYKDREAQPITVGGIFFSSMCEHHFMPFFGTMKVSYIPKDSIIGLSKIPRVIEYFSKKPQLQERLTDEIGEYLFDLLNPLELTVEVEATHTCVMCRGANTECSTFTRYFKRSM